MLGNLDSHIVSAGEGNKNKICKVSKVEDAAVGGGLTESKQKQTRIDDCSESQAGRLHMRCTSPGADWRVWEIDRRCRKPQDRVRKHTQTSWFQHGKRVHWL